VCGFAGVLNLSKQNFTLDSLLLEKMAACLKHRGPDGQNVWCKPDCQFGLAFARLSIIDLSSAGMQPMFSSDGSIVVCFNGEIYNYQALKSELSELGYEFKSNSDTEVLIYAYQEWGIDFLHKLEGMFAIALHDFRTNEFYLVRDRMGVKPLYFSLQEGILSFASEIKALWLLPWMKREISSLAMYHYLTFMVTPAPYTIFKNVYKLPAGFYAKVDSSKNVEFTEWYSFVNPISASEKKLIQDERYCVENIRTLFFDAVKKRMLADVPVGAFLSGGIDSSLIVAAMSHFSKRVKTFTVAFSDGPESNELGYARIIADQFDTDHHEIVISEKEAFEFYEKMVYHLDEPLADCVCIPFHYVSKLARDSGVIVGLVGEGADELFFGYNVYASYKKLHDNLWRPSQKVMPEFMRNSLKNMIKPVFAGKPFYMDLISNWANGRELFWGGALAFKEHQKSNFKNSFINDMGLEQDEVVSKIYRGMRQEYDSFAVVDYHLSKLKLGRPEADFCQQMMYLEFKQRLPELLLMRADKMSMAASLEVRVPFLDHKLVEFMFNVSSELKFKNNETKHLLKCVAQGVLPDEIVRRKKVGFAAPTFRWFSSGKYFPAYFQKMDTQESVQLPKDLCNGNKFNVAVQKWVLQQLWAVKNVQQ